MEHLTPHTLAELLGGGGPRGSKELLTHLSQGCETCDAVLEQHAALDGEVDRLLLALRPVGAAPALDEVGWARLRRGLRRPSRVRWAVAGAVAAALVLAFVAPRLVSSDSDSGLKGAGEPFVLELSAAVKQPDGTVTRIDDGAEVRADGVLLFRYHASGSADGAVWLQRGAGAPTRLGAVRLESGTHELAGATSLLGVSLAGESGALTVWVIGGTGPTAGLDPVSVARGIDSRDVGVGRVTVQVRP